MKQILMKLLKIGLIVTAVVLGLLIIFGLTLMFGWKWWVGFFILIGIVGLSLVGVILKKIWLKRFGSILICHRNFRKNIEPPLLKPPRFAR